MKNKKERSNLFMRIAGSTKGSPSLGLHLKQAETDITPQEAIADALEQAITIILIYLLLMFFLLSFMLGIEPLYSALITLIITFPIFFFNYSYNLGKYKRAIKSRLKDIDKNLLYALQTMRIHISSGLPMFESVKEISKGKYGAISMEFRIIVENVQSGSSLEEELEESALRNPSQNFRNSMWQIVNSIRTGTDLGKNIDSIISTITKEELVEIRKYGSKLNPLVLMFMMLAVIVPSMGVTVMIIIGSMPGAGTISELTFWMVLFAVTIVQIIFIRVISSKRPDVSVG